MARSAGLKRDLRLSKNNSYSGYNQFFFKSYCGVNGDSYDRYLIRMLEMGESLNLINMVTTRLLDKHVTNKQYQYTELTLRNTFLNEKKKLYINGRLNQPLY